MQGIVKNYPGVQALRGVDLSVDPGQVMGLVGENGAGKSTLLKVLAGAASADAGSIEVAGEATVLRNPRDSQAAGIAVIYQELMLAEHLSIAENVFAGREPTRFGAVDFGSMNRATATLLAELGVDAEPTTQVGRLNLARRQMVEIAKALSLDARLIVMDEPTSSLTEDEVEKLLALVHRLRERGVAVVYVSHRMREVFAVSDAITVMRDGAVVGVHPVGDVTPGRVVNMMVGRDLVDMYGSRVVDLPEGGVPGLSVRGLHAGPRVVDISFDVGAGEIVGVAGLVGAGRTETALAIFGQTRPTAGTVHVGDREVRPRNPREAIECGIAYVPEDRKQQGLFLGLPIRTNMSSACLDEVSTRGLMSRRRDSAMATRLASDLTVKAASVETAVGTLSGGNQQKVVLARWLARRPRVLILDEPTRGVDVGAKAEIYRLVREVAAEGVAVVVISSELPEVLGIADRVLVMREGHLVGELAGEVADEQQVMALATGVHDSTNDRPGDDDV